MIERGAIESVHNVYDLDGVLSSTLRKSRPWFLKDVQNDEG